MVSLPMMAKLLDAVRPDAQLVLVGDPGQLASVEAGSVLGDIAVPVLGPDGGVLPREGPLRDVVSGLTHSRRFPPGSPLDRFARAVRAGDVDAALDVLADPSSSAAEFGALHWHPEQADSATGIDVVRGWRCRRPTRWCVPQWTVMPRPPWRRSAASASCAAHRRGPEGIERWNARVESWLAAAGHRATHWYPGRPVLVTANDYANGSSTATWASWCDATIVCRWRSPSRPCPASWPRPGSSTSRRSMP